MRRSARLAALNNPPTPDEVPPVEEEEELPIDEPINPLGIVIDEELPLNPEPNPNPPPNPEPNPNPLPNAMADHQFPAEQREKIKIKLPRIFKGTRTAEAIRQWLFDFNNYTEFHQFTDAQKVAYVPQYLEGPASDWWDRLRRTNTIPGTFAEVETSMRNMFLPQNYISRLRSKLYQLKQITSVEVYAKAFREILLELPDMPEEEVTHLFMQGLKRETRLEVEMRNPADLNEAEMQALRVDDIRFAKASTPRPLPPRPNVPRAE
jgi:hypothetical protein